MLSLKKIVSIVIIISLAIFFGYKSYYFFKQKHTESLISTLVSQKKDSIASLTLLTEFFDLENFTGAGASSEKSSSGKFSCKLSKDVEYGFTAIKPIKDIPDCVNLKSIDIGVKCWAQNYLSDAVYVLTIDDTTGKNIFWEGLPISCQTEKWNDLHFTFELKPAVIKPEYIIKMYAWNKKGKEEFFIDDVSLRYNGSITINSNIATSNTNFLFDFETKEGLTGTDNIQETTAHSGKIACVLSGGIEYGPSVIKKVSDVTADSLKKISASVWIYPLVDNPNTTIAVSVINSKKETVYWGGKGTEKSSFPKNKWTKLNTSYNLPSEKINPDDVIQVNIWNKGRTDIIIDDLEIVYGDQPGRKGVVPQTDPNLFYSKQFVAQKNKPPFKMLYFEKQDIGNENSTFLTPDKKSEADFSPNDEFLVGNFVADKNNLEDIICIKKNRQGLFSYSSEAKKFQQVWDNSNSADSIWNENNKAYAGDFNNDGKCDILLVNKKNNEWGIIDFEGKDWKVMGRGTEKNLNKKWLEKNQAPSSEKGFEIFKPSDVIFSGNYSGDAKKQLLKLNQDWRFDLKLIEEDKDGYTISGAIDFKGYPDDHNPKYYEFIKIISGKFIDSKKSSLIIIMANCADSNFNGIHCDQFENVSYLPNSTQLYNLESK